ncbi:MAG: FAD-dependent protein [Armatimonadota bacterium]
MRIMDYDVVIIGAGPAGIFSSIELAAHCSVCIFDTGPDIDKRSRNGNILSGWGGGGAFSDGKLTLSPDVGGQLADMMTKAEITSLLDDVDKMWLDYSGPLEKFGTDYDKVNQIARSAQKAGLKLVHSEIRHLGTERCPLALKAMRDYIEGNADVRMNTSIKSILTKNNSAVGVETESGEIINAKFVIAAPGRVGSGWLCKEAKRLNIPTINNAVDIGVRVEIPDEVLNSITDSIYEPKLVYYSKSFDDKVRSFCVCPQGEVVTEEHDGVVSVNGHSYAGKKTKNTNFALLVSTVFTEPFNEPITYGRYVATLANLLTGNVLVQRLGDLESGRRSTVQRIERGLVEPTLKSAVPGDLSFVLPYRYLSSILEMLQAMDNLAPGIADRHTLLYGVEVKYYSSKLQVSSVCETPVSNLFAIGDGAGITRGLMQSSASGVLAAREIKKRLSS